MAITADTRAATQGHLARFRVFARRNKTIVLGAALLIAMAIVAAAAPNS